MNANDSSLARISPSRFKNRSMTDLYDLMLQTRIEMQQMSSAVDEVRGFVGMQKVIYEVVSKNVNVLVKKSYVTSQQETASDRKRELIDDLQNYVVSLKEKLRSSDARFHCLMQIKLTLRDLVDVSRRDDDYFYRACLMIYDVFRKYHTEEMTIDQCSTMIKALEFVFNERSSMGVESIGILDDIFLDADLDWIMGD